MENMYQEIFASIARSIHPWIFFSLIYLSDLGAILFIPSRKSVRMGEIEDYPMYRQGIIIGIGVFSIVFGVLLFGVLAEAGNYSDTYPLVNGILFLVLGGAMIAENFWKYTMIKKKVSTGEVVHVDAGLASQEKTSAPEIKGPGPAQAVTAPALETRPATTIPATPPSPVTRPAIVSGVSAPAVQRPSGPHLVEIIQCPLCKMTFEQEIKQKPFKLVCPHCGAEGVVK